MYGIFNGLFYGVGALIANVMGGPLLMKYGIRNLFLGTSVAGFIWTLVMVVYLVVDKYRKQKDEIINTDQLELADLKGTETI